MSSLFTVPVATDPHFCEGVVTEVDPVRLFCKVKTIKGQNLVEVAWLMPSGGGSRGGTLFTPIMGDRVVFTTSLGYPVIIGYLPKISTGEVFPTNIDAERPEVDSGDFSPLSNGLTVFGEKTGDIASGDQVITSEGGGLLGILRGGTILLKASRLAQIIISKFDDVVRIVARNYEVFSDSFIDVAVNVRGRIYRFIGYADIATNSRIDDYVYQEYFGDVELGRHLQGNYFGADPNTFPPPNRVIYRSQVISGPTIPVYLRTIDLEGEVIEQVQDDAATNQTTIKHDLNSITLQYNDQATIIVQSANVTIEYKNGGTILINQDGVSCTMGGHFMTLDSAGVHLG